MSGPPLGRLPKTLSKNIKKQALEDERIRNEIEGKFGMGKRRFSLNRVMAKLDQTSQTAIAITFLVMNLSYLLRQVNSPFLCQISLIRYFWGFKLSQIIIGCFLNNCNLLITGTQKLSSLCVRAAWRSRIAYF